MTRTSADGTQALATAAGHALSIRRVPLSSLTLDPANARLVVLEPCSTSRTLLVAAEQPSRRCYAMELSPAFVDAAMRRWELLVGQEARLESTGATMAHVAAEQGAA